MLKGDYQSLANKKGALKVLARHFTPKREEKNPLVMFYSTSKISKMKETFIRAFGEEKLKGSPCKK